MLIIDRENQESFTLTGDFGTITIRVLGFGQYHTHAHVRLGIDAPRDVLILRDDIGPLRPKPLIESHQVSAPSGIAWCNACNRPNDRCLCNAITCDARFEKWGE